MMKILVGVINLAAASYLWPRALVAMRFVRPVKDLGVAEAILAGILFVSGTYLITKSLARWKIIKAVFLTGVLVTAITGAGNLNWAYTGRRYIPTPDPRVTPVRVVAQPLKEVTIVAAGAIACASWYEQKETECQQKETAELFWGKNNVIKADLVLALGDIQYPEGRLEDFSEFDRTWGKFKLFIRPVPGNHEYKTAGAAGYAKYFGERAKPRGKTYYSWDDAGWHIVALDSNCEFGECDAGEQRRWLKEELELNAGKCVLAFMHHPRQASDERLPEYADGVENLWRLMAKGGVDVVLVGHHHVYERFAPVDGIREFVVGTGGRILYNFGPIAENSEVRINDKFGVLKMVLREEEYEWEFWTTEKKIEDKGAGKCN